MNDLNLDVQICIFSFSCDDVPHVGVPLGNRWREELLDHLKKKNYFIINQILLKIYTKIMWSNFAENYKFCFSCESKIALHMTSNFAPHSWIMILDFKGSSPPTQRPLFPGVWSKQWARRWEGLPCKHYFLDEHDDLCDHHGHHHPHIMIKSP